MEKLKDIDMELSEERIRVEVKGVYSLDEGLGMKVDNRNPRAKWEKKNRRLVLSVNKA